MTLPSLHEEMPSLYGGAASPMHGFQGDRARGGERPRLPQALTIAISREAGSRGADIARRVGDKLGWQVYTQELLEYSAQEETIRQNVCEGLAPAAAQWVEQQYQQLPLQRNPKRHPSALDLARLILALGAQGEVILIGRGAGLILPRASTLHVRLVAPLPERIAYMSQWLRLTTEEATEQVRLRDQRRNDFISTHFDKPPSDVYQYDLVLNTSRLGEELTAEMLAHAARAKLAAWLGLRE